MARGFGVAGAQLLVKRDRLSLFGFRLGGPARLRQQDAEIEMVICQFGSQSGDGGGKVGQLLIDRHRLPIFHFSLTRFARF